MEGMSDDILLEELKKRFLDNKKALHDMRVMNEKIEKLNGKLAESERLKTNFLSNIRNEINNPLTSILGISRELSGSMKDEATRQLMARLIYEEAFDLDFQLRNIFAAAELEAGDTSLSAARVDVAALINNVTSSFTHKLEKKQITVSVKCSEGEKDGDLPVVVDAEKLHLVVLNLVANAIEFNRTGKTVTIEAQRADGMLRIAVADEGIGIPEDQRDRLFERFHQFDQGPSRKHKGHGLGLSIVKAVVEMLGGTIDAKPAPGGGSVFRVEIPEAPAGGDDIIAEDGNEFLFGSGRTF